MLFPFEWSNWLEIQNLQQQYKKKSPGCTANCFFPEGFGWDPLQEL